jgi:hypothetical protein
VTEISIPALLDQQDAFRPAHGPIQESRNPRSRLAERPRFAASARNLQQTGASPRKSATFGEAPASETANGAGTDFMFFTHPEAKSLKSIIFRPKTATDNSGITAETAAITAT